MLLASIKSHLAGGRPGNALLLADYPEAMWAPSFHRDDRNLDPKTWCRLPILSGGFETELAELRSSIQASR